MISEKTLEQKMIFDDILIFVRGTVFLTSIFFVINISAIPANAGSTAYCQAQKITGIVDCHIDTCIGNSCYNGTSWVYGTKTKDCATVTVSANPSVVTPTKNWTADEIAEEISYITWEAKDASKLQVKCVGFWEEIDGGELQLSDSEWYASQDWYVKKSTEPAGFPFWFEVGSVGREICTFSPTNSSDGKAGTPKSVTIIVRRANGVAGSESARCGTADGKIFSSSESNWGSYTFCASGDLIPTDPVFPERGASMSWNCQTTEDGSMVNCSASRESSTCQPDDPGCAGSTCQDLYCFDGCEYIQGTKDCVGRR
jgi:hypothetical protein